MRRAIAAALLCVALAGCSAPAKQGGGMDFEAVADKASHELTLQRETAKREMAQEAYQERQEAAQAPAEEEEAYEPEWGVYEWQGPSQAAVHGDPETLNSFDGVYEHDGRTETFYSADGAAYASGLTVDEQGFYRDSEGRYAVAASDMPEGTVFQGSQGECVVVDSGCDNGITDYAVSGW